MSTGENCGFLAQEKSAIASCEGCRNLCNTENILSDKALFARIRREYPIPAELDLRMGDDLP